MYINFGSKLGQTELMVYFASLAKYYEVIENIETISKMLELDVYMCFSYFVISHVVI